MADDTVLPLKQASPFEVQVEARKIRSQASAALPSVQQAMQKALRLSLQQRVKLAAYLQGAPRAARPLLFSE
jgi:hypothetical protein